MATQSSGEEDYYKNNWSNLTKQLTNKGVFESKQSRNLMEMIKSPDVENLIVAKELIKIKMAELLTEGLNEGQTKAFYQIIEYFLNPETFRGVVLKGYAGTGKTFLIKRVIEYLVNAYPNERIAITAPTNKAVKVLNRNSPYSDKSSVFESYQDENAQIVYSTIHKLMGYKEVITDSGQQLFTPSEKNCRLLKYDTLVVDEISMLDDTLFDQFIRLKKGMRIILMGDPAQIPPVNKEHCKAFHSDCDVPLLKLELTEIMRQKGDHPIIEAGMIIRKNLNKAKPLGELKTQLNAEGKGIIRVDGKTQRTLVIPILRKYFVTEAYKQNTDFIKILAWRRTTVKYMNEVVRKILFGDNLPKFTVGEKIVTNTALFRSHGKFHNYTTTAVTSEEFTVTGVKVITKTFKDNFLSFTGKFWQLDIVDADNHWRNPLYIINEESKADYKAYCAQLKKAAIKSKQALDWVNYYNVCKWSDDVDYNYAVTVHKSQGSTYQNVFLIEEDLNRNPKLIERNRIKYTAYTRATDRLYVLL